MKTTHLARRPPVKAGGFSWGRFPRLQEDRIVSVDYRLFRRDHGGRLHSHILTFNHGEPRWLIAERVKKARHSLRDKVDVIDLEAMGVAA